MGLVVLEGESPLFVLRISVNGSFTLARALHYILRKQLNDL